MMLGRAFFLVLLGTVGSITYFWAVAAFPVAKRYRRALGGAYLVCLLASTFARPVLARIHSPFLETSYAAIELGMFSLILSALPIGLMRLCFSLATYLTQKNVAEKDDASSPEVSDSSPTADTMTRRQLGEATFGSVLLAAGTAALGYGGYKGRFDYELDELVVRIPGLPKALDGYTIAQISDLHGGVFMTERDFEHGLSLVRKVKADLVVATGDLVDFDATYAPMVARMLSDVRGRDGVVAILGNHDYYAGYSKVAEALTSGGVELLINRGLQLRPQDGGGFALLGVANLVAPRFGGEAPNLTEASRGLSPDLPRILLSHQPPTIQDFSGQVALMLSGHTHGGQINPGFTPSNFILKYVKGRYEVRGTTLYVNRGFGTAGPPSRVMAPPEVTKVVLVSA